MGPFRLSPHSLVVFHAFLVLGFSRIFKIFLFQRILYKKGQMCTRLSAEYNKCNMRVKKNKAHLMPGIRTLICQAFPVFTFFDETLLYKNAQAQYTLPLSHYVQLYSITPYTITKCLPQESTDYEDTGIFNLTPRTNSSG